MVFSKTFPRKSDKSVYPIWEEITLTEEEERVIEEKSKKENIEIMKECIEDAKHILLEKGLEDMQRDLILIATSLFDKRASHGVYLKEEKAKEKFDQKFKEV